MRNTLCITALLAAGAVTPVSAQVIVRTAPGSGAHSFTWTNTLTPKAVIGVTTSAGDARDTLGLAVTDVAANGPADKAGIKEGDRIQSINGINLKLAAIDIGDGEMADAMSRRLTRELGKLKAGDNVSLTVYHAGQFKTVSVTTVKSDDLYGDTGGFMRGADDNRAMLGVSLSVTGNTRDTLGVLITAVDDSGPAAKAGLEEGNRLAQINGVDLKVDRADAGDRYVANARYQRLQKEMAKVKPGDDVTLQVYADGRFKTVRVKTVKASDLGSTQGVFMFRGNDGENPSVQFNIDGQQMREEIQRGMQHMKREVQRVRVAPGVRWMDEDEAPMVIRERMPAPPAPPMPAMAPRVKIRSGIHAAVLAPPAAPAAVSAWAVAPDAPALAEVRAAPAAGTMILARPALAPRPAMRVIRF